LVKFALHLTFMVRGMWDSGMEEEELVGEVLEGIWISSSASWALK